MEKINYQLVLDKKIKEIVNMGSVPVLLLHSCCGPCSSYVLEYLSEYFKVYLLYYNPNIMPSAEYDHRYSEQKRLLSEMRTKYPVELAECGYDNFSFFAAVKGLENEPEGGARCEKCFRLRLEAAAAAAKKINADYFTTTLTVSPHKNAQLINHIGEEIAAKYSIEYLHADFKKKNGYKRSVELAGQYNLYRQNYCGCVFSLTELYENSD